MRETRARLEAELTDVRSGINNAYWTYTRTARGKPPCLTVPHLYRRQAEILTALTLMRHRRPQGVTMLSSTDPNRYVNDIPYETAKLAHNGTSFTPEKRAEQEREGYANTLAADFAMLAKHAGDDESKLATLDELFTVYRTGYRSRYLAMLSAKSRCMSTMITGGSNFPTRRNAKRSNTADKRTSDVVEYREMMLDKIRKALHPELRPIMAGDSDAVTRLKDKIAALKAQRELELKANVLVRNACKAEAKAGKTAGSALHMGVVADLVATGKLDAGIAKGLMSYARAFPWIPQFANHTQAEIRRCEQRLAALEVAKAAPAVETKGEHATIEDSEADNRVRLFYPGKPDAETRTRLKGAGFRWTPSLGCWQAYRNHRTLAVAKIEAGEVAQVAAKAPDVGVVCAAEENGMSRCDDEHKERGVACGACDPRSAEERGVLAVPFDGADGHEREAR